MSKEGKRELNRRDFVATSAAALVGVTCLGAGTKEALE